MGIMHGEKPEEREKEEKEKQPTPSKLDYEKPNLEEKEKQLSTVVGIQGFVLCKSAGPNYFPLQGALARISCEAIDEHGKERAPFSILSSPTDSNGYFFAAFSPSELEDKRKLMDCKAFLQSSPLETFKVPTDVNHGFSGDLLSSSRILQDKRMKTMKLYSAGPFFYTSQPN